MILQYLSLLIIQLKRHITSLINKKYLFISAAELRQKAKGWTEVDTCMYMGILFLNINGYSYTRLTGECCGKKHVKLLTITDLKKYSYNILIKERLFF